jgi:hypothetical protein
MKPLLLILSLLIAAPTVALADKPGADWLTHAQVTEKLLAQGFTRVIKLEADDGHWEGDAVKDGKTYEVHVDPHSGALTKSEPKD